MRTKSFFYQSRRYLEDRISEMEDDGWAVRSVVPVHGVEEKLLFIVVVFEKEEEAEGS